MCACGVASLSSVYQCGEVAGGAATGHAGYAGYGEDTDRSALPRGERLPYTPLVLLLCLSLARARALACVLSQIMGDPVEVITSLIIVQLCPPDA
jgi:hypothetical protein